MRRGTTPTYELVVEDADISSWSVIVTLKAAHRRIDLSGERLTVEASTEEGAEQTVITFSLTQNETLSLREGKCEVQVRAVKGAQAVATDIGEIEVLPILLDGEIHAQA